MDTVSPLTDKASPLADTASPPANEHHDFVSLSNSGKALGQGGKTIPSGESLGCPHCAAGRCEGSLRIFLRANPRLQTLSLVDN